ncbi:MAG: helix-turn-helix domain-containing protein [Rhodobacter sp.]|nr:helix-turn-helix domain-containing protein [Rhodobacter sp.]
MPITPREIEDRFEEAALTLRRLPNPTCSGPRGYGQSWPDNVEVAKHAYGYTEVRIRTVPSAAEIQRMDQCIDWLRWLDPEDAKIVWLRAEGKRWRQVCIHAGCVRQTAWRPWVAAILTVAKHLTANEKPKAKQVAAAPTSGTLL